MKKKFRSFIPYIILISFLSAISFVVRGSFQDAGHFLKDADFQLFILGGMIFVGYYINRIAPKTIVPSFVWAQYLQASRSNHFCRFSPMISNH